MRRVFALFMIISLLLPWTLCHAEPEDRLLQIAQETAPRLTGLCGMEGYPELFLADQDILSLIHSWGGDWAEAGAMRRAAVAFLPQDAIDALLALLTDTGLMPAGLSDYGDFVTGRAASALSSYLASRQGVEWIAAASVATYSEFRAAPVPEPGVAWVLLDYGEAHPLVMVSLRLRAGDIIGASASFVSPDSFTDAVFSAANGDINLKALAAASIPSSGQGDDGAAISALLTALDSLRLRAY